MTPFYKMQDANGLNSHNSKQESLQRVWLEWIQSAVKQLCVHCFTLKYQFQNHSDGTLTSHKASVYSPHFLSNICSGSKVRNAAKRPDCFTTATNARVQLSTSLMIVNFTHLTAGGSKVGNIHKTSYKSFGNMGNLLTNYLNISHSNQFNIPRDYVSSQ